MAYQPMFTMGGGMDMLGGTNPFETEEERRRREEEERRRMEQVTGPVAPAAPDQQYEAQGLQEGPAGQAMAGFRKPQPFKQTLTTDPVTGQQTMKMEGAPQDFTAANPNTPTMVSGPVMPNTGPTPDEIMREQEQARQYQQMMGQPPAVTQPAAPPPMAAAPVAPGGVAQPAPQAQPDTTRLGLQASQVVPGGGETQPAQAIQPPPAVAPTSQPRDLTQMAQAPAATTTDVTAGTTGAVAPPPAIPPGMAVNQETGDLYRPLTGAPPAAQPAVAPANLPAAQRAAQDQMIAQDLQEGPVARTTAVEWGQIANLNRDDPEKLLAMARAESTPSRWQKIYGDMALERFSAEKAKQKGEADAEDAKSKGRIDRIINRRVEPMTPGFFAKMYLLRALGFEKVYEDEMAKTRVTYTDMQGPDQKTYTVATRGDGLIVGAYGENGQRISDQELNRIAGGLGGGKDVEYVGGTFVNDTTGQVGRWGTNKRTGLQQIYTDKGPVPVTGFRPQGVAGSLNDQFQTLEQRTRFRFREQSTEQNLRDHSELNKLRINAGLPALTLAQRGLTEQGTLIGEGSATATAPGAPAQSPARETAPVVKADGTADAAPRRDGINSSLPRNVDANPNVTSSRAVGRTGQELAGQGEATKVNMEAFVKYKNDDLLPKAEKAANLSSIRRQQISGPSGILENPSVVGLLSGTGTAAREFQNIFRDIISGNFDKVDNMSARIASMNLPEQAKNALYDQLQYIREVTPNLIREIAPVGTITDFEQRMAKEAGVDVTRMPLYPALSNLSRSQFASDMTQYKAHFATQNPQLTTREAFEREWTKEKARLDDINKRIIQDRAAYIKKYGSTKEAVLQAFKDTNYPPPQWDPGKRDWIYNGASRNALRPRISDFER